MSSLGETSTPSEAMQASSDEREIQLRYQLAVPTFKSLYTIGKAPVRRDVLQKASSAVEFRTFPIKPAERALFREINDHTQIPYVITGTVSEPWHKVFLIVQIDLLRTGWPNKISAAARKDLHRDRSRIYIILERALRCLVDILGHRGDGRGVTVALDVLRSIKAGVWEGGNAELMQVDGIGLAKMQKLKDAGVTTVKRLAHMDFFHIERLLSRNPPFGQQMLHKLAGFPILKFHIQFVGSQAPADEENHQDGQASSCQLRMARLVLSFENDNVPIWGTKTPWVTFVVEGEDGRLLWFWRGSLKRLDGGKEMFISLRAKNGEKVGGATFACEGLVGAAKRNVVQVQ